MTKEDKIYILALDLNVFPSFYRELVAYCCGEIGTNGIGFKEAETFEVDTLIKKQTIKEIKDNILLLDDNGQLGPCHLMPSLNEFSDGDGNFFIYGAENKLDTVYFAFKSIGISFKNEPSKDVIYLIRQRVFEYITAHSCKLLGWRLLERKIKINDSLLKDSYTLDQENLKDNLPYVGRKLKV